MINFLDHTNIITLRSETRQNEEEVLKILHIRNTVHQFPDAFIDNLKIVKSYIPVANTSARIDILEHRSNPPAAEVVFHKEKEEDYKDPRVKSLKRWNFLDYLR